MAHPVGQGATAALIMGYDLAYGAGRLTCS